MAENIYETVIVLSPDLDEEAVNAHIDKFKNMLGDAGASIESVDLWGRRRLEYEIQRKREGIYYVVLHKMDTAGNPIAQYERILNIDESVFRHLTIRRDDLMKARAAKRRKTREIKREKAEARQAEIAAQKAAEMIGAVDGDEEAKPAEAAAPQAEPAAAEAPAETAPESEKETEE